MPAVMTIEEAQAREARIEADLLESEQSLDPNREAPPEGGDGPNYANM